MKLFSSVLMLLAASSSPFDTCGNSFAKRQAEVQANQPPLPFYCRTDPPLLCYGMCLTGDVANMLPPGMPPATSGCDEGGDLGKLFKDDVQAILVCDESVDSYAVFPPEFLITPVVVETGDGCMQPPTLPAEMPLKVLLNLLGTGMAP